MHGIHGMVNAALVGIALFAGSAVGQELIAVKKPVLAVAPTPGKVYAKPVEGGELVTNLRMLVSRIAPGDELRLAIHWDANDGPVKPAENMEGNKMPGVDAAQVLADMTFHITTPAGKTTTFRAGKLTDSRPEWASKGGALYRHGTYFLLLDKSGVAAGDLSGPWDAAAPALTAEGTYELKITGVLKLGTCTVGREGPLTKVREVKYEIGPVPFVVAAGAKSIADIRRAAIDALKVHAPDAEADPKGGVESAEVKQLVHEDANGLMQVYARGQQRGWSYPLYRVEVSPAGQAVSVWRREVGTCIAAGTPIDTPAGAVVVEALREGAKVWAYDFRRGQRVEATVRTMRAAQRDSTLLVGEALRVTAEHPVWAGGQWKRADELAAGDVLRGTSGAVKLAAAPALVRGPVAVFDLTVDGPHNFFAGGLLVHNKDRAWSANLDDAWYFYFPAKPYKWTCIWRRGTGPETKPAASAADVAELIGKLGASDFKAREAATEKLIALGEPVRATLEAKVREKGLDPEVASRIEQILDRLCPKEGKTVADRASGITVSLGGDGTTLEAKDTATGKMLWQLKLGGKATDIRVDGGQVSVRPISWVVDLRTGKVLQAGGNRNGIQIRKAAAVEVPRT